MTDTYTYDGPAPHVLLNTWRPAPNSKGKERDTETGNDDFGARYYTSRFGRWLSADWSSVPVPVPYANLTNPQTLNLYSMVSDDPESFADLDGHCYPWCTVAIGAVIGGAGGAIAEYASEKWHHEETNGSKIWKPGTDGTFSNARR
jgi:RHS repeat-associated protein